MRLGMLMPRGLPASMLSPIGSIQPYEQWSALTMRSPGNMMGKHLLNNRGFPNVSRNGLASTTIRVGAKPRTSITGEAPTK